MKNIFIIPLLFVLVAACTSQKKEGDQPVVDSDTVAVTADTVTQKNADADNSVPQPMHYYANGRFCYTVKVPYEFTPNPESENGDGKTFTLADGSCISVSASYNALEYTPEEFYAHLNRPEDTYRAHRDNWAVWSGFFEDSTIYYTKAYMKENIIYCLTFIYPKDQKEKFDSITKLVLENWKPGLDFIK